MNSTLCVGTERFQCWDSKLSTFNEGVYQLSEAWMEAEAVGMKESRCTWDGPGGLGCSSEKVCGHDEKFRDSWWSESGVIKLYTEQLGLDPPGSDS